MVLKGKSILVCVGSVSDEERCFMASVCPWQAFQPCLMFAGTAEANQNGAPFNIRLD
jgi:hypothetical protein